MFARGSIPWFIAHELRVTWRTWFQRGRGRRRRLNIPAPAVAFLLLLVATVAAGVPVARSLQYTDFAVTTALALIVDIALLFVFSLMMSQTLVAAVDAFYDRGDLDLLLSSPIPPTRILTMRAVAMAVSPALLFVAISTPFVLPMLFLGHPEMIGVPLLVISLALLATGIGLAIAIVLFRTIGPRRTRTVAQVLAAVFGALFVIVAQVPNIVDGGENTSEWIMRVISADQLPAFARWPAEAFFGAPLPLLAFVLTSLVVFFGIARWVGHRFAQDAAAAAGADTFRRASGRKTARFGGSSFRATIVKELRLIWRDPALISQVVLRVFYVIPLAILVFGDQDLASFRAPLVAGAASLLAGQLAGSIAWLAISAEDAPHLLASAPLRMRAFWRAKLAASVMIPVLLVGPLMIGFAFIEPLAGLIGLLAAVASAWSAALINLWLQKPSKRSDFRRSWSSTLGANLLELITSLSFAAAAGLAVAGQIAYAGIALAVALGILALARRSEAVLLERITDAA